MQRSERRVDRRVLIGGGAVALAAAAFGIQRVWSPSFGGPTLTVEAAHAAATAGDLLLIDIRRPDEWRLTGTGQGAHPIDMRRDDFIAALDALAGGDRARPVALICARGVRSARLARRLEQAGFTHIIDVPEGMLGSRAGPGWLGAGLPLQKWQEPTT